MSITAISSVSSSAAPLPLSATPGAESVPLDFANLLDEQLSGALGALLSSIGNEVPAGNEKKIEVTEELLLDPLQVAELGIATSAITSQPIDALPDVQLPEHVENLLGEVSNVKAVSSGFTPETSVPFNEEVQDLIPNTNAFSAQPLKQDVVKSTAKFTDALTASTSSDTESLQPSPQPETSPASTPTHNSTDLAAKLSEALTRPRSVVAESPLSLPPQARTDDKTVMTVLMGETANISAETPVTTNNLSSPVAMAQTAGTTSPQNLSQTEATAHIPVSIHDNQWTQSFGEKVVWMAKSDQQSAQISINPPQLGPMQISLNMNGDQATAIFASPHAEVRQAIEDAMPRLREMLSSAGITLGDANVGTQLPQQNRDNPSQFTNPSGNGGRLANENAILAEDGKIPSISTPLPIQRGRGLVDLFA